MTHFVASLGFSTEPVVRPIMGHGIADGDTIELIHPNQDGSAADRVESVITDIRGTFQTIGDNVSVERTAIEIDSYRAIEDCSKRLATLRSDDAVEEVVVVLGGGSNEVVMGLLTATLAHYDSIASVQLYGNAQSASFEVALPRLIAQVPGRADSTFSAIVTAEEPQSVSDIAATTDQSVSTAGRHIDALEAEGLITTSQKGGKRLVRPTPTARLLLDAGVVSTGANHR